MFSSARKTDLASLTRPDRKASTLRNLIKAAVIAAVLVPLGTVAIEGSSIYCGFGTESSCAGSGYSRTFDFVDYQLTLDFDVVTSPFVVKVTDVLTDQESVASRLANFPGFKCVTITALGSNCVDFVIDAPTGLGFYDVFIHWNFNTEINGFPNELDRIRILHNRGDVAGNGFDTDITVFGTYESDPGIGGRDNNFASLMVLQSPPIPEPATLALVASGLGSFLYHRRRKRRDADTLPRS